MAHTRFVVRMGSSYLLVPRSSKKKKRKRSNKKARPIFGIELHTHQGVSEEGSMAGKIMRLDPISKEVSTEMEALANYLPTEIAVGIQKRKKRSPNPRKNMKQRLAGGGEWILAKGYSVGAP